MVRHIRQEFGDTFTICVAGMKISVSFCACQCFHSSLIDNFFYGKELNVGFTFGKIM